MSYINNYEFTGSDLENGTRCHGQLPIRPGIINTLHSPSKPWRQQFCYRNTPSQTGEPSCQLILHWRTRRRSTKQAPTMQTTCSWTPRISSLVRTRPILRPRKPLRTGQWAQLVRLSSSGSKRPDSSCILVHLQVERLSRRTPASINMHLTPGHNLCHFVYRKESEFNSLPKTVQNLIGGNIRTCSLYLVRQWFSWWGPCVTRKFIASIVWIMSQLNYIELRS